tara:strand:- start:445 stop:819 length:375 start_codon:yes stop_codon:yes gene_type:complete
MKAGWNCFWVVVLFCLFASRYTASSLWRVTAYCSCKICCGRWSDGSFASGKHCYVGGVANNWLGFGSTVSINGKTYTVEDRGSTKYFGKPEERRKAIDIYMNSHEEAKEFGVQWLPVKILKEVR